MISDVNSVIATVGGRREFVALLVAGCQRLWDAWADEENAECWATAFRPKSVEALAATAFPDSQPVRALFAAVVSSATSGGDAIAGPVTWSLLEPESFVILLLPHLREDDRRFFVCAAIRNESHCRWSPELRRTFHHLAAATADHLGVAAAGADRVFHWRHFANSLLEKCVDGVSAEAHHAYVKAYLQVIRHLRLIVPVMSKRGQVRMAPEEIDPEFVVANLFGVSTGIAGLDQLFGGSGPILPEAREPQRMLAPTGTSLMQTECLPARLVLIRGPFGCGKSLIACHIAASVARKGGIANIASVEQEPAEYLYMLSSMGLLPSQPGFDIEFELPDPTKVRPRPPKPTCGALVYTRAQREQFDRGFMSMVALASEMTAYPLRLLVIDSLNGLAEKSDRPERKNIHKAFRDLTTIGVNTIIIEEENEAGETFTSEDENLADTVIRVSVTTEQRYWKRRIQIKKCRFQREQRGEHPFSIASDNGINVVPGTAAVRTRIAQRRARSAKGPAKAAGCLLDGIVGTAPRQGHVMVVEGRSGTMKSALLDAILAAGGTDSGCKLFVGEPRRSTNQSDHAVRRGVKFVPRGFSNPGTVFQVLDEIFLAWRRRPPSGVATLAIDDIAALDFDAPLAAADPSIGHVLVDYLRRQDALSIVAARSAEPGDATGVRQAVIADADYHVKLVRISAGGEGRVLLTVLKSPDMVHRRGWFDLIRDAQGVRISKIPALVNVHDDQVRPLSVTLFLFADATRQSRYNASIISYLRTQPNLDIQLASQEIISDANAFHLEGRSGHADVRIIQLDEFQLPDGSMRSPELWRFAMEAKERREFRELLGKISERASTPDGFYHALPYYCNIGFLVCRQGLGTVVRVLKHLHRASIDAPDVDAQDDATFKIIDQLGETDADISARVDWLSLAVLSDAFERYRDDVELRNVLQEIHLADEGRPACLFEHTGWMDENYNVLYLEILLWLRSTASHIAKPRAGEKLEEWILTPEGVEAAVIFRRLCRPGNVRTGRNRVLPTVGQDPNRADGTVEDRPIKPNALVWRQWFTTLGDLADDPSVPASGLMVRVLPGNQPGDCSVAGEWYVGVLGDSVLPEAGLALINALATPQAELDRLRRGIGLPTRRRFYRSSADANRIVAEPWSRTRQFNFAVSRQTLCDVLENAFRRSQFDGYAARTSALSFALWSILDFEPVPGDSDNRVRGRIRDILQECARSTAYTDRASSDDKRDTIPPPPP